jgi:hypothetical protein
MEDAQKAATILVQFPDGTQLDSCAAIGPRRLGEYFELVPGQAPQTDAVAPPPVSVPAGPTVARAAPSAMATQHSAGGKWMFDIGADPMTDIKDEVFILQAESKVVEGILEETPSISIFCTGTGKLKMAVFDSGLVLSAMTHESHKVAIFQTQQLNVRVRLDAKIGSMQWDEMGTTGLYIGKRDLEKILDASDVRIEFPTFAGGYPVSIFKPAGLDREQFGRSCGLK